MTKELYFLPTLDLHSSARANEFKGRIPKELGSCEQLQFLYVSSLPPPKMIELLFVLFF